MVLFSEIMLKVLLRSSRAILGNLQWTASPAVCADQFRMMTSVTADNQVPFVHDKAYIDGEWVSAADGRTFQGRVASAQQQNNNKSKGFNSCMWDFCQYNFTNLNNEMYDFLNYYV